MKRYDLIVVGAGPSGIFLCYELMKRKPDSKVLLIDQGRRVEKRVCPVASGGKCVKCKPFCHIPLQAADLKLPLQSFCRPQKTK